MENGSLLIAEDEVEIIRIIYDRYIHTNSGINGVTSYLNDNGYTKKLRQNNTIRGFSSSFVKSVLDNPIYMGKIAYGRRRTEKKIGTKTRLEHQMDNLDNTFCEAEQKDFMRAFIEWIDLYPEKPENDCWIRNIVFNFPVPIKVGEVRNLPLESKSTVEKKCVLCYYAVGSGNG